MIVYADAATGCGWQIDFRSVEPHEDFVYHLIEIEDDRYGGTYSGAAFTAWPGVRPSDIDAGDIACEMFWDEWRDKALYGCGSTAQEAFRDLIQKTDTLGIPIIDKDAPDRSTLRVVMLHAICERSTAMLYASDEFRAWLELN